MDCADRNRLREDYNHALDVVVQCAEDLEKPFTATTFSLRLIAVRAAKDDCKRARDAWEAHLRLHICGGEVAARTAD